MYIDLKPKLNQTISMRKKLLSLTLGITALSIIWGSVYNKAYTDPTGSPNARTGSPGDGGNTCAISGCHTGIQVSTRDGLITSNIPQEGYTPGTKYTITATAKSSANRNTFGFQISPQSPAGALLGTITITNSTQTQVTGAGKYVTHKQAGITGSNGTKTWSFDWTAPVAGTGNVTFYGSFNYANSNGLASGDSIIKTTYTVSEKLIASVNNEGLSKYGISFFPNPVSSYLKIQNTNNIKIDRLEIYDMSGKLVFKSSAEELQNIDLKDINAGVYFVKLFHAGVVLGTEKIVKN